ncbi:unnamed protein product [Caenorhabditis bovis]|uniref:NOT2/NOT3/NOT5 C-terminal domain-containing protein n=1 Tax=Caenorhabditis bovis TaxID=2654633 RepID=A0A8S1EDK4_9PELO|nr:unnamed protein product [Caenorhabditis bovis]
MSTILSRLEYRALSTMARRGLRSSGSSKLSSRSRPSSVTDGDRSTASTTNEKSARSTPAMSVGRGSRPVSPSSPKKGLSSNKADPKFTITNEDFPELPVANVARNAIAKGGKKEKDSPRPQSTDLSEQSILCPSTDDSGVSSSSRGTTPQNDSDDVEPKKKTHDKQSNRKPTPSPTKDTPVKTTPKQSSRCSTANGSPKKKTGNSSLSSPCPPSFIKISKSGIKVPERRGANSKKNEAKTDTPKVNQPASDNNQTTIENGKSCRIIVNDDGEMSNIPPTMLTDQFGLAALLPIITLANRRKMNPPISEMTDEQKKIRQKEESIELLTLGIDLNNCGVPMNNSQNKPVWKNFSGVYGHDPLLPPNIDIDACDLPNVYYTASIIPGLSNLDSRVPKKLGIHELFFIFYNFPGEYWQVAVTVELVNRGWRFFKGEKVWVRKTLHDQNLMMPPNFAAAGEIEMGIFEVYDKDKARIISREMCVPSADLLAPNWEKEVHYMDKYVRDMTRNSILKKVSNEPKNTASFSIPLSTRAAFNRGAGTETSRSTQNRRLLSFVDSSPDRSPLPPELQSTQSTETARRQMYQVFLQMQQQQKHYSQQQQQQFRNSFPGGPYNPSTKHF